VHVVTPYHHSTIMPVPILTPTYHTHSHNTVYVRDSTNNTNNPTEKAISTNTNDQMVRITLYKNGFKCNGYFFNNDEPDTKKYLEDIMQSKVSYDFMKKCGIDPEDEKTFELADNKGED